MKRHLAGRRDDERVAGRQLRDGLGRNVERRLDGGAFARDDGHVVVDVAVAGPNAVRVARGECPAVTGHPAERPCAVGIGEGLGKGGGQIVFAAGSFGDLEIESFLLGQFMRNHLADEVAIGLARGERAALAVVGKELGRVREVEVPREEERVRKLAGFVQEGMAKRHLVPSEGGVTQMAEEDSFARNDLALRDGREYVGEGGRGRRFADPIGQGSQFRMVGEDRHAGTVLSPVVLFLQKERELRAAEVDRLGCGIPILVRRLPQDHHRHGAFMLEFVRHVKSISIMRAIDRRPHLSHGFWGGRHET